MNLDFCKFVVGNASIDGEPVTYNKFVSLTESAQTDAADAVVDNIFDTMLAKYTKVNFGDIPQSKGNILRFKQYEEMSACIDTLISISVSSGREFPEAVSLKQTRENLVKLAPLFEKAFASKNAYIIMLYNTMVMTLYQATSVVIVNMIDFIKDGESVEIYVRVLKDSSGIMLINAIREFNDTCCDGTTVKYINEALNQSTMHESIGTIAATVMSNPLVRNTIKGVGIAGAVWLATKIVPITKQLVYLFYHTSNKISDAANIQAEFLQANIQVLKNKDAEGNAKIIAGQGKYLETFKRISRTFAVNNDKAQHDTKGELQREPITDISDIVI